MSIIHQPDSFSDHIIYIDESGDHGLQSIDPNYPVFVLAFCIFHKAEYAQQVSPAVQDFKFKYFGHDMVILHEYEIRKARGDFRILLNKSVREPFMEDLNRLIAEAQFTLISTVIEKNRLREKYVYPDNPYYLSLAFGLERSFKYLQKENDSGKTTFVVMEKRGKREDDELELEFRRICDGANYFNERLPFLPVMVDKKVNSSGLQVADLLARPIGRHFLNPAQPNRAWDILEEKFDRSDKGKIEGWGLKCFP